MAASAGADGEPSGPSSSQESSKKLHKVAANTKSDSTNSSAPDGQNDSAKNNKEKLNAHDESIAPSTAVITELEPEEPHEFDENDGDENHSGGDKRKKNQKSSKEKEKEKSKKEAKSKKSKKSQNKKNEEQTEKTKLISTEKDAQGVSAGQPKNKPRALVEELKLFQNDHLLHQEDPIQQLHIQLNALIEDDDGIQKLRNRSYPKPKTFSPTNSQSKAISRQYLNNNIGGNNNCLSSPIMQQQQLLLLHNNFNHQMVASNNIAQDSYDNGEKIFIVKKGVLWQQQNYDKFHQRLFSRWKKRYFILTTDYLVCFKKSSAKVGRSEMGKFVAKTPLNDVIKVDWLKPKKSDKGAIVLELNKQFKLLLWCKENLDDWMFMIKESVERNKVRRSCFVQNDDARENQAVSKSTANETVDAGQLYQNTAHNFYTPNDCVKRAPSSNAQDIVRSTAKSNADEGINDSQSRSEPLSNSPQGSSEKASTNKQRSQQKSSSIELKNQANTTMQSVNDAEVPSTGCKERVKKLVEHNQSRANDAKPIDNQEHTRDNIEVLDGEKGQNPIMIYDPKVELTESHTRPSQTNSGDKEKEDERKELLASDSNKNSRRNLSAEDQSSLESEVESSLDQTRRSSDPRKGETNLVHVTKKGSGKRNKSKSKNLVQVSPHAPIGDDGTFTTTLCNSDGSNSTKLNRDTSCDIERNNKKDSVGNNRANGHQEKITNTSDPNKNIVKVPPAPAQRSPSTNLIRRDDSWQSLVSLTRIGKVVPSQVTVAQRSLYAQHIMPNRETNNNFELSNSRQGVINIESSITPSRAPFLRQQSVQPMSSMRKLRPFPAIGQQHAASFDVAPNSPMQTHHQQQQQHQTSYQHKLLQLQLLHNSNNVDYIRHNGADNNNDYQIYGPESIATNHYGYSSMRSNLKSAASEFSFIRPSSLSHHAGNQSTPLHHTSSRSHLKFENQNTHNQQPFILSKNNNNSFNAQQRDSNNNEIGLSGSAFQPTGLMTKQYLINPLTGERIVNQTALEQSSVGQNKEVIEADVMLSNQLAPPMRELPMKPGKKRAVNANTSTSIVNSGSMPKSSSLTSSIACFFRRAFSRRSKRAGSKRRSAKLAESCSSSLGAFEDNLANIVVAQSAFSTGSKSDRKDAQQQQQQQQALQSQRMIDMIEAFTNKTQLVNDSSKSTIPDDQQYTAPVESREQKVAEQQQNAGLAGGRNKSAQPQLQLNQRTYLNQFGSPLHKSNSISATMGLSHHPQEQANNLHNFLYDNEIVSGDMVRVEASPMLMRSSKVMSVNLTPLMSQRKQQQQHLELAGVTNQQQLFLSPRNGRLDHHQMPRPSSIYGQPSMISSPVISRGSDKSGNGNDNNFGKHRNSIHNPNFIKDKTGQYNHNNLGQLEIARSRQQVIKTPFLDTTREVAEEILSPTASPKFKLLNDYERQQKICQTSVDGREPFMESMNPRLNKQAVVDHASPHFSGLRHLITDTRERSFDMISASPSSNRIQNQAIVNPILQSPTMDTIYDNHPMLNGPELQSHYDNHNQLLMDNMNTNNNLHTRSPSLLPKVSNSMTQFLPSSPIGISSGQEERSRYRLVGDASSHRQRLLSTDFEGLVNKKPSAIVAPSTPNHYRKQQQFRSDALNLASPRTDQFSGNQNRAKVNQMAYSDLNPNANQPQQAQPPPSRSPMMSRRLAGHQTGHYYQQSPLVSQQTRVLNRADGVQATVIGVDNVKLESYRCVEPAVNIAGAPGINLEPSLAASLLRGTNIDAYECSTFGRNVSGSSLSKSNNDTKTFLVSTRLSKSMAHNNNGQPDEISNRDSNSSPTNLRSSSAFRDESSIASMGNNTTSTCPKSSREELSGSSGSRSITSSIGKGSQCSRVRVLNASRANSQEDSGEDNNNNKSKSNVNNRKLQREASDQRRDSSSEPSDEVGSNAESLSDRSDERKWITSKLVE